MIRLGIAGLGRGFMLTLPAFRADPRVVLAGAFDVRQNAREAFAAEFHAKAYASFEQLVADDDIDAVYIATPHELHAGLAIAALRAGKHVLVEKPMATSLSDGIAMVRAAAQAGRILVVGPSHGFDPPVLAAADLVASGTVGAVRMVTAFNFTDFMLRPRRPEELDEQRGGGVVYSQATHQIDAVRRLVGKPVKSVRATTGNWDPARQTTGAYAALLNFEGGAVASLTYSGYGHYDSDELVGWISELGQPKDPGAYGEARRRLTGLSSREDELAAKQARTYAGSDRAIIDGAATQPPALHHEHFGFILVSCERADIRITPEALTIYGDTCRDLAPVPAPSAPRQAVLDEFVASIQGHAKAVQDGEWGLMTMATCAALIESSHRQADVSPSSLIPPNQETSIP